MKRIIKIGLLLSPAIFILWMITFPPKTDMSDFNWTQTSEQNDWKVSSPKAEGFNPDKLIELHQQVTLRKSKKVQSLLITRNDKLIFEQYYPVRHSGDGTPMPDFFPPSPDTYHNIKSVTKTVTSTLIGHLLYKKEIANTDISLFDYFNKKDIPNFEKKRQIKLRHALDFNSGLDWAEWHERHSDAMSMWLSDDPYQYIFQKGIEDQPGKTFVYQGAMSVLLGGVIEKITKMNLKEYTNQALFQPLGITHYDWFAHEVTGDYLGSSGLYLRPRDLAKLGQLYINQGVWKGQRIFSKQWAQESLKPKGKFWPNKSIAYGHNWWFPTIKKEGKKIDIAGMRGTGGQEVFIIPQLQLTIVITSGAYMDQDDTYPFKLIVDYILPSLGIDEAEYIT
ncbi:serine hydrolase [Photobacterium sp. GB-210]|uniref:serine hydrolase domain-containing protein n=1 Tax=Photobacterium sp. GB-210 TaxID=2022104 RepID=UPI000D1715D1|nr:serine hydrolase [Photobacterium sp. GB-210]PSV34840.1 hypothetical protein C9J38_16930 [Photobacterium sp. GB-210]